MGKQLWRNEWLTQLAACIGYALAFLAIHSVTSAPAHWHLYAGLQVVCLLLVPYRYWAALLLGEAIPSAYEAWQCLDSFGPTWVAIRMVPELLLGMPIVWLCRSRLHIFPARHLVNIKALLICILLVSVVLSAYSYALISSVPHIADSSFRPTAMIAAGYLTGNYAGLITLVPWSLIVRLDYRKGHLKRRLKRIWSNTLSIDALGIAAPVILLMMIVASKIDTVQAELVELSMLIPAAWLTVKHGWRAAAIAGTLVIICVGALQPDLPTRSVVEVMAVLCVAVSGLYALGAKVTAQNLRDEREYEIAEEAQKLARENLMLSERRMRRAAEQLEFVAGSLHITHARVLDHMRRIIPNVETHGFYKQSVRAQEQVYRVAESLHPSVWRDRGLPAALNETIARTLDEAGMGYRCEISGRGFMWLDSAIHSSIYRVACEAIVFICSQRMCSRVMLRVRAGKTRGRCWVVVRVEGYLEHNQVANAVYFRGHRRELAAKLGTHLVGADEMRTHVKAFGGELHVRSTVDRMTVTALLHSNVAEMQKERVSAPLRLWVS
ncbi:hypothetical protein ISP15_16265 [Dyella jejuensis]|uniref:MASE1 domain-containing protein n=1 Tax=Dyella jejuensis TaxID=1432009 RepID=A0ABW8JQ61_9GAMM